MEGKQSRQKVKSIKSQLTTTRRLGDEERRQHDIEVVMVERESVTRIAKELLPLLRLDNAHRIEADKLVLELSQHLGNLGGFCDNWTRQRIHSMQRLMALTIASPLYSIQLKAVLPLIVGIQIDFSKRPFRAVGVSFEGWGAKLKALLER